jgi:hypothetical protein
VKRGVGFFRLEGKGAAPATARRDLPDGMDETLFNET